MVASFLRSINDDLHVRGLAGGSYGGSGRSDGAGLPQQTKWQFAFATGIECSSPTIAGPNGSALRRDMLDECGHYTKFEQDLALVHDLGLRVIRYGLPYHKTHLGPGRYDWSFADLAMAEISGSASYQFSISYTSVFRTG